MDKISAEFAAALIKATSLIEGAVKDSDNPYFKSKYADLAAVIAAIKEPLIENGIAFFQKIIPADKIQIETIAIYKTGEVLSLGTISLPIEKNTAQAVGSAISYARRYGLACAFSVPQLDDDGHAASQPIKGTQPQTHAPSMETYVYKIPSPTAKQLAFFEQIGVVDDGSGFFVLTQSLGEKADKYLASWEDYQSYLKGKK